MINGSLILVAIKLKKSEEEQRDSVFADLFGDRARRPKAQYAKFNNASLISPAKSGSRHFADSPPISCHRRFELSISKI